MCNTMNKRQFICTTDLFIFRGKNNKDEITVGMLFQEIASETYLFCLCQDGNIRLWSTSRKQCSIITDLMPSGNQGSMLLPS